MNGVPSALRKERKDSEQETSSSAPAAIAHACPSQMKIPEKMIYPDLHQAHTKQNLSEVLHEGCQISKLNTLSDNKRLSKTIQSCHSRLQGTARKYVITLRITLLFEHLNMIK